MRKILYHITCLLAIVVGLYIVWLGACAFVDVLERISIEYVLK